MEPCRRQAKSCRAAQVTSTISCPFLSCVLLKAARTVCRSRRQELAFRAVVRNPQDSVRGASLGQHKNVYDSLCCCVGDCVVRHCHLYPLYSWQDSLLAFAEMELDSTTMLTPGTDVMFIRSTGEPVLAQVVGYSEHGDA